MPPLTRTIRQQVTDQIRNEVVSGDLPAGEALRETEFAERYGVSRGPIRDAFLQLSQEGFLSYHANRGVTVRTPPDPDARDLIVSLRLQIESHAIKQGVHQLGESEFAKIDFALQNLHEACKGGDASAIAMCDFAFHEAILISCEGESFLPIWKWLCSQMLMAYTRLENYDQVYQEHAEILAALKIKQFTKIAATLKSNIR